MCGRFSRLYKWKQLHRLLNLALPPVEPVVAERYNVAPTDDVPVVIQHRDGTRTLEPLRWGLVPFWAKDPKIGNQMINARAETVATKPGFRDAIKQHRCLVPISGFYEWQKIEGSTRKQPWYIKVKGDDPFMLAGLWERWKSPEGELRTFTIITTTPNELVRPMHDRMPVIVQPEDYDRWLNREITEADAVAPLLAPFPAERMEAYRVGTRVNKPGQEGPECIRPVEGVTPVQPGLW